MISKKLHEFIEDELKRTTRIGNTIRTLKGSANNSLVKAKEVSISFEEGKIRGREDVLNSLECLFTYGKKHRE